MKARMSHLPALPVALALIVSGGAGSAHAGQKEKTPYDEARLFFELNDTDGDLGIHALIDGEPWKNLIIQDMHKRRMLNIWVKGRLRQQGLTELFFESAEPPFDELVPAEFFERFPEGEYEIKGRTLEGDRLETDVMLSHVLPAPPQNIMVGGMPAAEDCDAEPLPAVSGGAPVTISWDAVTTSHPEIGSAGDLEVEHYQFVVEREEPQLLVFNVELPPGITQFDVPAAFLALGEEFKFEILVRATNGNQTAVESCFEVEQP